MAQLNKKVIGEIRGKVGGIVVKVRNGKQYIASTPSHYTMSNEPHEVDKRNRFKVNGLFAKAVKESEILYRAWEKEKAPATTAYNKICKVNFKLCETNRPTEKNLITPGGFNLPITTVESYEDRIEVEIGQFDLNDKEIRIIFVMLISFFNSVTGKNKYFDMGLIRNYKYEDPKLIFDFSEEIKQISKRFKNRTVYLAAVTENEKGEMIRTSKTTAKDFL